MDESHAVKWVMYRRVSLMKEEVYTRWHWTEDGCFTVCGHNIPVMTKYATMPRTDEDVEVVNCKNCLLKLK